MGNGHIKVVKYLHEEVKGECTKDAMNWASENGHLEVVKAECKKYAMDWASKNGHIEIVTYLKLNINK